MVFLFFLLIAAIRCSEYICVDMLGSLARMYAFGTLVKFSMNQFENPAYHADAFGLCVVRSI